MRTESHHPIIQIGDRILLAPAQTGQVQPEWVAVELIEHVSDPTTLPWNTGPGYPWRVGYRTTVVKGSGDIYESLGVLWLDDAARDARAALLRTDHLLEGTSH